MKKCKVTNLLAFLNKVEDDIKAEDTPENKRALCEAAKLVIPKIMGEYAPEALFAVEILEATIKPAA